MALCRLSLGAVSRASGSAPEASVLLAVLLGLLISVTSVVEEHRFWGTWASIVKVPELSSCGSRKQDQESWRGGLVALWHVGSSWNRVRPQAPARAGRFLTTGLPERSPIPLSRFDRQMWNWLWVLLKRLLHCLFGRVNNDLERNMGFSGCWYCFVS